MLEALKPLRERSFSPDEPVKVSVCCIAFNHADYIRACIEGFLDQVCDFRVEIIVHDDASTDRTAEIIREYAARFPSIFFPIIQQDNQYSKGVNPYYSYVFPAARGEYISICDGDDYWSDQFKISTQVSFLDANSDFAVSFGSIEAIENGELKGRFQNGLERDLSSDELKIGLPINTLTACFRNVFRNPPVFLRSAPMGDMTVWAALGHHGSGKFLAELKPAFYRIHSGGIFSLQSQSTQLFMGTITLLSMAAYHHERQDYAASRACLKRAIGQIVMIQGGISTIAEATRKSFSLWTKSFRRRLVNSLRHHRK